MGRAEGLRVPPGIGSESIPKLTDHTIHRREGTRRLPVHDTPFPVGRGPYNQKAGHRPASGTNSSVRYVVFFFLCFLFFSLYCDYCYCYKLRGDSQKLTVESKHKQLEKPGLGVTKKH